MSSTTFDRLDTRDGYEIAYRRFDPPADTPARAVVIIASAMGVKQDFYSAFASWLGSQGVVTFTFDYRGMGASRPQGLRGFRATILDWARLDCAALIDEARARHPELPMFWLGHSVGAQIFGLIPNREHVQAMLSIAAGSGYWRYNAAPLRYYVLSMWLVMMPLGLRFAGYFPGKKLGMVGDLPYGVAAQWRRWCLDADYLGVESERVREQLANVEIPITALSMQDDELMTLTGTRALFSLYSQAQVEVQRLKPSDHGLRAIGHFGFFRPKMQAPLWPLVSSWIERMSSTAVHAAASYR
jgi:predicted alpha/beta hydrolase